MIVGTLYCPECGAAVCRAELLVKALRSLRSYPREKAPQRRMCPECDTPLAFRLSMEARHARGSGSSRSRDLGPP